ncbi:flagellar hook-basal body complex protein [Caloramator sp. E03]|uniref:flagellar hook-basal body complex protein n=1 Tax=Caloramator sp. E03 TaxID=2576307 RepID=UPI001110B1F7|nr:flagellar hook-basal body complex protein [Caloramator sp. E03]QCX32330.1 flagellar hook-basal body complex protein [Caloramator sp. E03]
MIRGLYIAASGMITRQIQQENLSNDAANINTPGYKKDKIALKTFQDVMVENRDKIINGKGYRNPLGNLGMAVGIDEVKTDYSQGILEETNRNLDFAINGEGFFTVVDGDGNKFYTRNGRFKIDSEGYLTTMEGYKVLGLDENDNEIEISVKDLNFELSSDGTINTGDNIVKFYISNFDDKQNLIKDSSNNYTSDIEPNIVNSDVKQGYLEKSNVDATEIITDMIKIMRSYEANQKVLQQMDETLGKAINEVGSVK